MEYDKEFEAAYRLVKPQSEGVFSMHDVALAVWQAARKDHYRIGEEVESYGDDGWKLSMVTATREGIGFTEKPECVRRIPAWRPKEGEAVFLFTGHENRVHIGRFDGFEAYGRYKVITQSGECARTNANCIKPFSADKIGKPWEEI